MTRARATLVSVEDTPYYHCVGRCVRRAFLCGFDALTKRSFEHRRIWMQERLALLTDVFAIDICAYALLSNHYHLVIRLCPERVNDWSDREVVERWTRVYAGSPAARKYLSQDLLSERDKAQIDAEICTWRARLGNLSWFMRSLNEYIARKANAEDDCTGHFWEARFKSQALLDEAALLTAMAYVDLNPIRANAADSIAHSDFTSGQDRWHGARLIDGPSVILHRPRLLPFIEAEQRRSRDYLPFKLDDYLDLIDSTGRIVIAGKRGFLPQHQPKLLDLLNVNNQEWFSTVLRLHQRYELAIGTPENMIKLAKRWGKRWIHGIQHAKRLYPALSG